MKDKFLAVLNSLYRMTNKYDEESAKSKADLLAALGKMKLPPPKYSGSQKMN